MTQTRIADDDVQIALLAMNGHAGLAADMLVERFGLSEDYAQSVLDQGYGLLVARMGRARAKAEGAGAPRSQGYANAKKPNAKGPKALSRKLHTREDDNDHSGQNG